MTTTFPGDTDPSLHRSPQRRARPMEMGPSTNSDDVVLGEWREEPLFVQPVRDETVLDLEGRDQVGAWMLGQGIGCKGSVLIPIDVNGTAGFAAYKPAEDGRRLPWASR